MTGATLNFCLSKNLFPVKQSTLSSFALVFSDNECALVEMVYILKKKKKLNTMVEQIKNIEMNTNLYNIHLFAHRVKDRDLTLWFELTS